MKPASSSRSVVMVALLALLPNHARAADTEENRARVQLMSRNERARLSKALEEFDRLTADERNSIRDLDTRLNALGPEARNRALSVLRRYHAFYKSLPEEKQGAIKAARSEHEKLELIASFRAEQKQSLALKRTLRDAIQISRLSPTPLRPLAKQLIVYFSLDPTKDAKERTEFAKLKDPAEISAYANRLIQNKGFDERAELRGRLREEAAEFQDANKRILENPSTRALLNRVEGDESKGETPATNKNAGRKGGMGPNKARAAEPVPRRFPRDELIRRLDEQEVIRESDKETVDPILLEKFEAALPPWARQSLDDLPPDAARRRLKTIYRLVFPRPEEYKPPKVPDPPARSNRRVAPRGAGPGAQF